MPTLPHSRLLSTSSAIHSHSFPSSHRITMESDKANCQKLTLNASSKPSTSNDDDQARRNSKQKEVESSQVNEDRNDQPPQSLSEPLNNNVGDEIGEINVSVHTFILISYFKLSYNLLRYPDGTFNRHLDEFFERKVSANANPVGGVYSFDIIDKSSNLLNRVYRPAPEGVSQVDIIELEKPLSTEKVVPVIVFFHGGSFTHFSIDSAPYDAWCRNLVRICNAVVVSVSYRRSPEYKYPCAYDDGWSAVQWVNTRPWLQSGKDLKAHIYLAGDSSGGNIAHHVAVRASESGVKILGNVLLQPMFGGQKRTDSEKKLDGKYFMTVKDRDWYWRAYLPEGEDRDHPACNIFGPRSKSIEGLDFPKSLVVIAGLDLCQDWQLEYVNGLRDSGHEVKLLYLKQATIGFYFMQNNEHFPILEEELESFVKPCSDLEESL